MSPSDKEFLRLCLVTIVTRPKVGMSAAEVALTKRAKPLWVAGYVTEKVSRDSIGRNVLTIRLTDAGHAALTQPS